MKILVTGGGTIAPIDDVRHVANFSTGRFAAQITEAWLALGHDVWHLATPAAARPVQREAVVDLDAEPDRERARVDDLRRRWLDCRYRLHARPIVSGEVDEYAATLRETLGRVPIDAAFLAAAVSDFAPERTPGKIASADGGRSIRCRPTPKVIRSARDWSPSTYLVGFKLLSGATIADLIAAAEAANVANRADLTVANDFREVVAGRHRLHLVRPGKAVETLDPGPDLAARLVARVGRWLEDR